MTAEFLDVAVGIVINSDNQVLIARRHRHSHQGGLWEFPGGKIEPGESVRSALCREFAEELGLDVKAACPLQKIPYHYQDKSVLLHVWLIAEFAGRPHGREGQAIRWQDLNSLQDTAFPAANRAIVRTLKLPAEIAITPPLPSRADIEPMLNSLQQQGVAAVQFRQKQLHADTYLSWFAVANDYCEQQGMQLFFNHDKALMTADCSANLHLSSRHLHRLRQRPVDRSRILTASCHDLGELQQAERLGVDLAMLSPVSPTDKYDAAAILGWDGFEALATQVYIPVYALGGMSRDDLACARSRGGFGIAGIRTFLDGFSG